MKARHDFNEAFLSQSKEKADEAYKEYLRIELASRAMQGLLAGGASVHDQVSTCDLATNHADQLIEKLGI